MAGESEILAALQELGVSTFPGALPAGEREAPEDRIPACVFKQLGGGSVWAHDGEAGTAPVWEVRCWAGTYSEAKTLAKRAKQALATGAFLASSEVDGGYEELIGAWSVVLTATGWLPSEEI